MSDEQWWPTTESEDVPPGNALEPQPREFTEAELYKTPAHLTAAWIERQLPKSVWKANKSKLNPHLIYSMCEDARKGLSKRAIMARIGMQPTTWDSWQRKAFEGSSVYEVWYMCIMHSISSVEAKLVDNVMDAADNDWRAAKWLLERINKDEYSDAPSSIAVTVNTEKPSINSISDENALAIANILQELGVVQETVDAEVVEDDE
jgi:hypothetical protein